MSSTTKLSVSYDNSNRLIHIPDQVRPESRKTISDVKDQLDGVLNHPYQTQ